ncbi:MAG: hypothetical protein N2449_01635, partial [Bacteroidales bacterium]|nr:hypothetical protein [Bacteroidales bacterium]
MKTKFFILMLSFFCLKSYSQTTTKVYNTIVFPKNLPHSVILSNAPQKDIHFELYGNTSFIQSFASKINQNSLVISCFPDSKKSNKFNLSLSPETGFDDLKNMLIQNNVEYVSIEDTIIPIQSWYAFSEEQVRRIGELNFTITNIEAKRNWVLQNPEQLEKTKQNG